MGKVIARWKTFRQVLVGLDWPLIFAVLFLVSAGLVLIYSATHRHYGNTYVAKQATLFVAGILVAAVVVAIPDYSFRQMAELLFVASLVMVLLVYFFGAKAFGARRWLPILGVRVQPSEFLKVATILVLAKYADYFKERINSPVALLTLGGISGTAFIAILKQPDLGTAMTIMAITGGIVFVAGIDLVLMTCLFCLGGVPLLCPLLCVMMGWPVTLQSVGPLAAGIFLLFLLVAVVARLARLNVSLIAPLLITLALIGGILASPLIFNKLNPYQRLRLTSFLQPEADPRGSGYNLIQSMIAIGSGGFWGKGLYRGSQNVLGFLPHKHTDFIFSVLGEECGFWGIALLIGGLAVVMARSLMIATSARDNFGTFVCVGVSSMFAFHFLVNIGMTVGMMPITGLPLLFVSYGGSALLSTMFCVGLLLNISLRRERFTF
jgi:rod shape determining protein RodA